MTKVANDGESTGQVTGPLRMEATRSMWPTAIPGVDSSAATCLMSKNPWEPFDAG